MADDDPRVPAGWYPDPLGLPQLRWWDNHAWTEHTSDARQPMVVKESTGPKLAFIDDEAPIVEDELPSRREMRERERLSLAPAEDGTGAHVAVALGFDEGLRSLEAPARDSAIAAADPAPAIRYAMSGYLDDAPTSASYDLEERYDDLLGMPSTPRSSSEHASNSGLDLVPASTPDPSRPRGGTEMQTSTGPVVILTLIPVYMLVVGMLLLLGGTGTMMPAFTWAVVLGLPWAAGVVLAFFDRRALRANGILEPAHWAWALLGPPVYLGARLVATVREVGTGFGPVLAYLVLAVFTVGAVVAVPGLVIELAPSAFSAEAEASVETDAAALGADITADCPDAVPMLIGQSFTCVATTDDGAEYKVVVSLQRSNGWIDWRVDDWGVFTFGD